MSDAFGTPMDCSPPGYSVHGISRQEYWSELVPFPFPEDLPSRGIQLSSPALAGRPFTTEPPGKPPEVQRSPYTKDSLSVTWRCPLSLNTKAHTCPPPSPTSIRLHFLLSKRLSDGNRCQESLKETSFRNLTTLGQVGGILDGVH